MFRNINKLRSYKYISHSARILKENESNAKSKLNELLLSIAKEETVSANTVQIPKPRSKQRLKKLDNETKKQNLGKKIVDAAKVIAQQIPGDEKETEAKLLHKLLYKNSELTEQVLKTSNNQSLKDLLSNMEVEKVEQVKKPKEIKFVNKVREKIPRKEQRIDLFHEKPLGIFDKIQSDNGLRLKMWNSCEEREMKLSVTHPPSNYFEQMIDWTNKGIVWKFPIDNEQNLEEERNVSFAQHVLLENQLEGWCPPVGPIRHFMELVCVGLSKNYWLTAAEKHDHINWYKEFFSDKRQLIKEIGAGEIPE